MKTLLAQIAGARAWLTLLVVAAAAAYLYAQLHAARSARDALVQWADATCAAAGTEFAPAGEPRGRACRLGVAHLAAFRNDTNAETARILADAAREREARLREDARIARDTAIAAADAARAMEKADAEIDSAGRVDRDWFARLNAVAGLRAPDD